MYFFYPSLIDNIYILLAFTVYSHTYLHRHLSLYYNYSLKSEKITYSCFPEAFKSLNVVDIVD